MSQSNSKTGDQACTSCGKLYAVRPEPTAYPANAPLWPWKYCDACIAAHKPMLPSIVEQEA